MCTIRTNAFKKFPLEDRALAREKTREGESERRSIVGVYLRPACFIFKTVNSLWFCNLFFVPVAKRPSTRRRCTALRLPAFRRAEELRSLAHSFVRSFVHSAIVLLRVFFLFTFSFFFFLSLSSPLSKLHTVLSSSSALFANLDSTFYLIADIQILFARGNGDGGTSIFELDVLPLSQAASYIFPFIVGDCGTRARGG